MTPPRWDLVAEDLKRYRASSEIVGEVMGAVATHMTDQSLASLQNDLRGFGLDPSDPVVVFALLFMVKRFAQYMFGWVPVASQTGAPIPMVIDALERALGGLLLELVPTEARPAE